MTARPTSRVRRFCVRAPDHQHPWPLLADGDEAQEAAALRAAIRERAEHRVDVVKIMASGGVTTAGTDLLACHFSRDDVRLMVDEATPRGYR
jgi:hypothetical protein